MFRYTRTANEILGTTVRLMYLVLDIKPEIWKPFQSLLSMLFELIIQNRFYAFFWWATRKLKKNQQVSEAQIFPYQLRYYLLVFLNRPLESVTKDSMSM